MPEPTLYIDTWQRGGIAVWGWAPVGGGCAQELLCKRGLNHTETPPGAGSGAGIGCPRTIQGRVEINVRVRLRLRAEFRSARRRLD